MTQLRQNFTPDQVVAAKNLTGSTVVKGSVVQLSTTVEEEFILPSATTVGQLGIVMYDIIDGQFGDIQTGGLAIALAGGAITLGAEVMPATSGKCVAFSAGGGTNAALLGKANVAASGDGQLFELRMGPGPFAIKQG